MNILFISNYKDIQSGWAEAAKSYIRAIATIPNVDLAIRPVYMGQHNPQTDADLLEYEYNQLASYDAVIQKVLPHLFVYDKKYGQNIGLSVFETYNIQNNWSDRCRLMDKLMTPAWGINPFPLLPFKRYNISQPVNLDQFNKQYEPLTKSDDFIFYFIGENITRKNWLDIVTAFYTEFAPEEPVQLIIKTSQAGLNSAQVNQIVDEKITRLKQRLRLYWDDSFYKKVIIITEYLSEENLRRLHCTGNCFIMPSYGEAFCRPLVEAMGFGNHVLATDNTAMKHFVPNDSLIDSTMTIVDCKDPPLADLYTGNEYWSKPNLLDLRFKMREMFNKGKQKRQYDMSKFSYEYVGQQILKAIEDK